VQLIGLCIGKQGIFIVTEYIAGGDLRERIIKSASPQGPHLSWTTKVNYAYDVALAMEYLHNQGIMHRDLKSANLLVSNLFLLLFLHGG